MATHLNVKSSVTRQTTSETVDDFKAHNQFAVKAARPPCQCHFCVVASENLFHATFLHGAFGFHSCQENWCQVVNELFYLLMLL